MKTVDINHNFGFHTATPVTGPKHDEVRLLCRTLAHELNELLPEGRHKSLAFTKLEEVMHRANAAIACDTTRTEHAAALQEHFTPERVEIKHDAFCTHD